MKPSWVVAVQNNIQATGKENQGSSSKASSHLDGIVKKYRGLSSAFPDLMSWHAFPYPSAWFHRNALYCRSFNRFSNKWSGYLEVADACSVFSDGWRLVFQNSSKMYDQGHCWQEIVWRETSRMSTMWNLWEAVSWLWPWLQICVWKSLPCSTPPSNWHGFHEISLTRGSVSATDRACQPVLIAAYSTGPKYIGCRFFNAVFFGFSSYHHSLVWVSANYLWTERNIGCYYQILYCSSLGKCYWKPTYYPLWAICVCEGFTQTPKIFEQSHGMRLLRHPLRSDSVMLIWGEILHV